MLRVGCGKAEITAFERGVGMLGYGQFPNRMEEIETPLYARAMMFSEDELFCFVNVELAFVTPSLVCGVLHLLAQRAPELKIRDHQLMITAQHTHSGPGGFSFHCLYNLTTPGFVPSIYRSIVRGITDAILQASGNLTPAKLGWGRGEFDDAAEIGMIRSIKAFNRNPEVHPLRAETAHQGINREMQLLRVVGMDGQELGCINWFGVHCTNLSNDNTRVCSDNKGYAAELLERDFRSSSNDQFQAIFAQGTSGDVSPKIQRNPRRPRQRGKYDGKFPDDIESAKYNGNLQFEKARQILAATTVSASAGPSRIRCYQRLLNFGNIKIDPEFADGRSTLRTSPACFGIPFIGGAIVDGPGAHPLLLFGCGLLARSATLCEKLFGWFTSRERRQAKRVKYAAQGRKNVFLESGECRVLGTRHVHRTPIPGFLDKSTRYFKRFHLSGAIENHAWTPQVMPIQLVFLGRSALAAFPFEITTIAGQRFSRTLTSLLQRHDIDNVVLCPYANAYSGYITTFEEYQAQEYEGGHTLYGEWSLAALQTAFKELIQDLPVDSIDYQSEFVLPQTTVEVDQNDQLVVRKIDEHLDSLHG